MGRRLRSASFVIFVAVSPAAAQSPAEIQRGMSEFTDLQLLQAAQKGEAQMGRFDRVATEQSALPIALRPIAEAHGFSAYVYRDRYTGESKAIFRGSDAPNDFLYANIPQAAGKITLQHNLLAPIMGHAAKNQFGVTSCAGFSLGAANAAIGCGNRYTDLPVTTANGARLNAWNSLLVRNERVTNYRTANDPVSGLPIGSLVGKVVQLPAAPGRGFEPHSIDAAVEAARPRAMALERLTLTNQGSFGRTATPTPQSSWDPSTLAEPPITRPAARQTREAARVGRTLAPTPQSSWDPSTLAEPPITRPIREAARVDRNRAVASKRAAHQQARYKRTRSHYDRPAPYHPPQQPDVGAEIFMGILGAGIVAASGAIQRQPRHIPQYQGGYNAPRSNSNWQGPCGPNHNGMGGPSCWNRQGNYMYRTWPNGRVERIYQPR